MHGVSLFYPVNNVFFVRSGVFLLQIDDIARFQNVSFVRIVVSDELSPRDFEFFRDRFPTVSFPGNDVKQVVGQIRLVRVWESDHPVPVGLTVIPIELVQLDDVDQSSSVIRISRVACPLQPLSPAFVVFRIQSEQEGVALTGNQKFGMIFVRCLCMLIGSETLVSIVIVVAYGFPVPALPAFNAEVVVGITG